MSPCFFIDAPLIRFGIYIFGPSLGIFEVEIYFLCFLMNKSVIF